jgi:hypothetical protein
MLLDMSEDELKELYEYIQTVLGGEDVDVDISEKEIRVLARRALKDYLYEIIQWQTRNQFLNIVGTSSTQDFTNKFVIDNEMLPQRISDWFASMQRVGGKIPWKKDYIVLEGGRQVYDLSSESSEPYIAGTRRIHRVMWFAAPEIFGSTAGDLTNTNVNLFSFGQSGLSYGSSSMMYLGNLFDVVLLAQALEQRNKVLRSEFFYNISGDILEVTPMPGRPSAGAYQTGSRVYYYYIDEQSDSFLGLTQQNAGLLELIANPIQVKITNMPYSTMNDMSKSWIDNYTLALAKYTQAAKWRRVRTIASPNSEYQIEFDYTSLIDESKAMMEELKAKLNENLLTYLDSFTMMEHRLSEAEAAAKINRFSPRKIFIG